VSGVRPWEDRLERILVGVESRAAPTSCRLPFAKVSHGRGGMKGNSSRVWFQSAITRELESPGLGLHAYIRVECDNQDGCDTALVLLKSKLSLLKAQQ
jgi:hypothetical protein